MKHLPLVQSCAGLLFIAGACAPLASIGEEGSQYNEAPTMEQPAVGSAERGAQGPIRTETMDSTAPYGEGSMYDKLRHLQSSQTNRPAEGAKGPLRSETMAPERSSGEGNMYDDLKRIQSTH